MQYLIPKLIFGCGSRSKLAKESAVFGNKAAFFYSGSLRRSGELEKLLTLLKEEGITPFPYLVDCGEEPTATAADLAGDFVKDNHADMVIAAGGGAVLDLAKAAAALCLQDGRAADYAEGVGSLTLKPVSLPFIALPTTAGTGSEMTKNSVLHLDGYGKRSIRTDSMLAKVAIVDPELTLSVPPAITAASGADALCQLIECYTTKNTTLYTDGLALAHIRPMAEALPKAVEDGSDLAAREILSIGACVSGIGIANAGLGLDHGIAGILGGRCGIRHGICCGILLPHAIAANAAKGVSRYIPIAREFGCDTADPIAAGNFLADYLTELNRKIGIPEDLREYHISRAELRDIAKQCETSSSMRKNPVPFTADEIYTLLEKLI